jgi:hypothetical protein
VTRSPGRTSPLCRLVPLRRARSSSIARDQQPHVWRETGYISGLLGAAVAAVLTRDSLRYSHSDTGQFAGLVARKRAALTSGSEPSTSFAHHLLFTLGDHTIHPPRAHAAPRAAHIPSTRMLSRMASSAPFPPRRASSARVWRSSERMTPSVYSNDRVRSRRYASVCRLSVGVVGRFCSTSAKRGARGVSGVGGRAERGAY